MFEMTGTHLVGLAGANQLVVGVRVNRLQHGEASAVARPVDADE